VNTLVNDVLDDQSELVTQIDQRVSLTAQQYDIWLEQMFMPKSPAFIIGGYKVIEGDVDIAGLKRCYEKVINEADVFNIRIYEHDGEPFQTFDSASGLAVELIDLSVESDPDVACMEWINNDFVKPFELYDSVLHRVVVLKSSGKKIYSYFKAHHIVCDGWTVAQLNSRAFKEYNRHVHGETSTSIAVGSYKEYVLDSIRYGESDIGKRDYEYWKSKIIGMPDTSFIQSTQFHGELQNNASRRESISIEWGKFVEVFAVCVQHKCTPYNFILSVLFIVFSRLTNKEAITFGVPFLNRRGDVKKNTAGLFANMLPIALDGTGEITFLELMLQVNRETREARDHQRFSLGELVRRDSEIRGKGRLYDVSVSYMDHDYSDNISGTETRSVILPNDQERAPLAVFVSKFGNYEDILLEFDYQVGVVDKDISFDRVMQCFATVFQQAKQSLTQKVSEFDCIHEQEILRQIALANSNEADYPAEKTVHALFEEQVLCSPNAKAVSDADESLTYSELNARANQLARHLRELCPTNSKVIAIKLPRSVDLLVSLFAVLKAGCAYLPIDCKAPTRRISHILENSEASLLISNADQAGNVEFDLPIILMDDLEINGYVFDNLDERIDSKQLAYVIYTSGSTGNPKGVMLEHHSLVNRLSWMQKNGGLGQGDVLLQKTPYTFDVSVWELFWWSWYGASLDLLVQEGERDPWAIVDAIDRNKVTVIHFVPSMFALFLSHLETKTDTLERVASLRLIYCSGEALPIDLYRRHSRLFSDNVRLVNLYGPTEATIDVSYFECNKKSLEGKTHIPLGSAIDNTSLHIVSKDLKLQPTGVPGELCIGGVGLARGYLGQPELTQKAFVDNPFDDGKKLYRTGDLARQHRDGNIEYLGRLDDQVKIRGNRIELGEIENSLQSHESIDSAVVVCQHADARGDYLCAYYVAPAIIESHELVHYLSDILPEYMVPAVYIRLAELPLTSNGKVNKRLLPKPNLDVGRQRGDVVAPRNDVEADILAVWIEQLKISVICVTDNFFTVGGDSLIAIRIKSELERRGVHFTLADLYNNATIESLAAISHSHADASVDQHQLDPFELIEPSERAHSSLANAEDAFPASQLQLGMLFHSQQEAGTATYNDVMSYKVSVPWNEAIFTQAISEIVGQHEVLRSFFDLTQFSSPLQIINKQSVVPLVVEDLRSFSEAEQENIVQLHRNARSVHQYDWSQAPLFLFAVHIRSEYLQFTFSFHHALLDGWSVATLITEIFQRYLLALGYDVPQPLPAPEVRLSEFIEAEIAAQKDKKTTEFWKDYLQGGATSRIESWIPFYEQQKGSPFSTQVDFDSELSGTLVAHAKRYAVPLKSLLMAVHCMVIKLLSGQDEVVTGVVTQGRVEKEGSERLPGMFLNTLPIRVSDFSDNWIEFAKRLFIEEKKTYPHRRKPIKSILETAESVLSVDIAFNFTNFHIFDMLLEARKGVSVVGVEVNEKTNFDLLANYIVDPRSGNIMFRLDCNPAVYTKDQVNLIVTYYQSLVRRLCQHETSDIADIAFLEAELCNQ